MTLMSADPAALRCLPALNGARELVYSALRRAVHQLSEPARAVAAYHFGWQAPDGAPLAGGGKMLRAAFVLEAAHAACGRREVALPGAVAVELLHNSTLLKDDVMDRDAVRRHRPSAWAVFGDADAILVSDALLVLASSVLLADAPERGPAAVVMLAEAFQELVIGQAMDMRFQAIGDVSFEDCYRMVTGKTASLIRCSTSVGALLAGADAGVIDALGDFGLHVGLSFQFVDDILGVWGDPGTTGKPVGSDIRARKKSLSITFALGEHTPTAQRLRALLTSRSEPTTEQVGWAVDALTELGARQWAVQRATEHLEAARRSLVGSGLPADRRAALLALAEYAVGRSR